MDQITPATSPEAPRPAEILVPLEGDGEIKAGTPLEKLDLVAPQSERLSSASSAVSQVVQDDQLSSTSQIIQDGTQADSVPSTPSSSSLIADDVDVIEKIWVQKAKTIVNETRDDPHKQSTELSHMKRDYIKKRFDKDIKLSDG